MPRDADIQLRHGTATAWTSVNPVLDVGEPGAETDTGKLKIGDGTTAWTSLPYVGGSGGGVTGSTTPTSGDAAEWDTNLNLSANQVFTGFNSFASSAGTKTMTIADAPVQEVTGTTTHTIKLPTTGIPAGAPILVVNKSTGAVTVQSSGANTILVLAGGTSASFYAEVATPTTAANWSYQYGAIAVASGKGLTVSNTLTFVGTDGTTMTFPSGGGTALVSGGALGTPASGNLANCTGYPGGGGGGSTTPTASTGAEWDANVNMSANAFISGNTSTATAAGTTTLTIASTQTQVFTGTSTQTVKLPTTGVVAGAEYIILNQSTKAVTVQSSGANSILVLSGGRSAKFRALTATPTTAANWTYQSWGADLGGIVQMDDFPGTDDQKLTAAMAYCSAQTYPPAIQLPARSMFFAATQTPYNGMKIYGPTGSQGPKDPTVGNIYNHIIQLAVGVDASAWFACGSTTYNDVYFSGLNVVNNNAASQFMSCSGGGGLYGAQLDSMAFTYMTHIFGSAANKMLFTQVSFTGHWECVGGTGMQMHLGGSDNSLWMGGICNMGNTGSTLTDVYNISLDGFAKSAIGYLYLTCYSGWAGINLVSNAAAGGCSFHGGTYEGANGTYTTAPPITIAGGDWSFHGGAFNYTTNAANGTIIQTGGTVAFYSPTYVAAPSPPTNWLYQTGGSAIIVAPKPVSGAMNAFGGGVSTALSYNDAWSSPSSNLTASTGFLASCQVVSLGNETFTIASGSVTQITGTTTNGYAAAIGDRILIANAPASTGAGSGAFSVSTQPANGIYVVTGNTTNLSVSRATDFSGSVNPTGLMVFVEGGGTSGWDAPAIWQVYTPTKKDTAFTWGTTGINLTPQVSTGTLAATGGIQGASLGLNGSFSSVLHPNDTGSGDLTLPGPAAALYVDGEQFCTLTSAYTLTSQTAAQKLFNTTTNGAVALPIGTYFFEALVSLTSLSTSNSNFGFALGVGTATISNQLWESHANAATLATPAAPSVTVNTAANTGLVTGTPTAGVGWAKITGKLRVSAAGTVIPQISLNTAAAAIVGVDSYFRVWSVGANTVTHFGTWT